MSNVFTITKKSVDFLTNMFNFNKHNADNLRKFIETEYKPDDRQWAYEQWQKKSKYL